MIASLIHGVTAVPLPVFDTAASDFAVVLGWPGYPFTAPDSIPRVNER